LGLLEIVNLNYRSIEEVPPTLHLRIDACSFQNVVAILFSLEYRTMDEDQKPSNSNEDLLEFNLIVFKS
jgi:hypothetical protein